MHEIIYGVNSLWIAGFLLASMVIATELGYRIRLLHPCRFDRRPQLHHH